MIARVVLVCLAGWVALGVTLSPLIGSRLAGRSMTEDDRALLGWGGLGFFMALFLLALLLIGTHT